MYKQIFNFLIFFCVLTAFADVGNRIERKIDNNNSRTENVIRVDRTKSQNRQSEQISARSAKRQEQAIQNRNQIQRDITEKTVQRGRSAISTVSKTIDIKDLQDNKSCQQEVNDCLDQFCAVLDDNKKRCMCSESLPRYTEIEKAVKSANTQLNSTVQKIRYVGLSADEVNSIMSETEAESVLSTSKDITESRNMLNEIEKLVKTSDKVGTNEKGVLDLDFNFDEDLSLDFLEDKKSGFANLRGLDLFNNAKKRCDSVIKRCGGKNSEQLLMNYEVLIHKDCKVYEKALNKMNETLAKNVRSANQLLQKARLTAVEDRNQFDLKGCVGELNKCMTDKVICGENYEKCLDPTKEIIDENGNIILGSDLNKLKTFMSKYENASINKDFIKNSYNSKFTKDTTTHNWKMTSENTSSGKIEEGGFIVKYLLDKIGTGEKATDNGLCRGVLDKCRKNTYTKEDNVYEPYNEVIVNYIRYAMTTIRAQQEKLISDYSAKCVTELNMCYNKQVSKIKEQSGNLKINDDILISIMKGACKSIATTCASAIYKCKVDDEDCINSNLLYQYLKPTSCPGNSVEAPSCYITEYENCVTVGCSCGPNFIPYKGKCETKDNITKILKTNYTCTTKSCSSTDPTDCKYYIFDKNGSNVYAVKANYTQDSNTQVITFNILDSKREIIKDKDCYK